MQAALEFLARLLAGVANFLYAQITGAKDAIIEFAKEQTNTLVTRFDELVKQVQGVQNSVSENAKTTDDRLLQIQQQNKDDLSSITGKLDEVWNSQNKAVEGVANDVKTLMEKADAQLDVSKVEDAFYKYVHEDIAKTVKG